MGDAVPSGRVETVFGEQYAQPNSSSGYGGFDGASGGGSCEDETFAHGFFAGVGIVGRGAVAGGDDRGPDVYGCLGRQSRGDSDDLGGADGETGVFWNAV